MAQFTNQATLSYNGITTSSNVVTGELTQVLTIWKDATTDSYNSGDILTYVVSIHNSSASAFTGLVLTDDLGAYTYGAGTLTPLTYTGDPVLYYINGILQTAPSVTPGPPMVIRNLSVPAGSSAIIIYRVQVNSYAPLGANSAIDNTATLTGGGLATGVTGDETVDFAAVPELTIIKALNPPTVVEDGQLTYTFTIQNTGAAAADASAGIVITDDFTPVLNGISVMLNGVTWPAAGNYTYNAANGLFQTVAGRITVPAATYEQDANTGIWSVTPGVTMLTVTGTV